MPVQLAHPPDVIGSDVIDDEPIYENLGYFRQNPDPSFATGVGDPLEASDQSQLLNLETPRVPRPRTSRIPKNSPVNLEPRSSSVDSAIPRYSLRTRKLREGNVAEALIAYDNESTSYA